MVRHRQAQPAPAAFCFIPCKQPERFHLTGAGYAYGEEQVSQAACAHALNRGCSEPSPLQTQGTLCMLLQASQGLPFQALCTASQGQSDQTITGID